MAWGGRPHRPTKDLDLLGFGEPGQEDVARRVADIAALSGEDGIRFDIGSIKTELIKEDAEYEGVRVHLTARPEQARVPLQIDIGFGDAVTPEPIAIHFPTILDRIEAPVLRIYPPEVVIAEKLHAMVVLDIRNSRMKDFLRYLVPCAHEELRISRPGGGHHGDVRTAPHAGAGRIALCAHYRIHRRCRQGSAVVRVRSPTTTRPGNTRTRRGGQGDWGVRPAPVHCSQFGTSVAARRALAPSDERDFAPGRDELGLSNLEMISVP